MNEVEQKKITPISDTHKSPHKVLQERYLQVNKAYEVHSHLLFQL